MEGGDGLQVGVVQAGSAEEAQERGPDATAATATAGRGRTRRCNLKRHAGGLGLGVRVCRGLGFGCQSMQGVRVWVSEYAGV